MVHPCSLGGVYVISTCSACPECADDDNAASPEYVGMTFAPSDYFVRS